MFAAIMILFIIPYLYPQSYASIAFYPLSQSIFWSFTALFILLTWIGGRPIETPFDILGQIFTATYFLFFFIKPLCLFIWDKLLK
jgi:quinol-cytochrome oxidoreductase complex cytochrome b subunit